MPFTVYKTEKNNKIILKPKLKLKNKITSDGGHISC